MYFNSILSISQNYTNGGPEAGSIFAQLTADGSCHDNFQSIVRAASVALVDGTVGDTGRGSLPNNQRLMYSKFSVLTALGQIKTFFKFGHLLSAQTARPSVNQIATNDQKTGFRLGVVGNDHYVKFYLTCINQNGPLHLLSSAWVKPLIWHLVALPDKKILAGPTLDLLDSDISDDVLEPGVCVHFSICCAVAANFLDFFVSDLDFIRSTVKTEVKIKRKSPLGPFLDIFP
uniref:Uncharacterized protein n=1 Tax=Romanomermis culicivorax TaxID=13658 RepID=A0A915KRI8_ROMCU